VDSILNFGAETHFNHDVTSLKNVLDENFDAVFVGTGAPKGLVVRLLKSLFVAPLTK
jgi:hypothetical protein